MSIPGTHTAGTFAGRIQVNAGAAAPKGARLKQSGSSEMASHPPATKPDRGPDGPGNTMDKQLYRGTGFWRTRQSHRQTEALTETTTTAGRGIAESTDR